MFKFERTKRRILAPDMTPLVDIVFQLLLFFMLTTTFIKVEAISVMVNSGKKATSPELATPDSLKPTLVLRLKGDDVFIDGSRVEKPALGALLSKELAGSKNREVRLLTEKGVSVQNLVNALDMVKKSGGQNIAIDSAGEGDALNGADNLIPKPVPMPDLQSTKNMPDVGNAANFDFDALQKGFAPEVPKQ